MSTFLSFFSRQAPQTNFTPAPKKPTQIIITYDTTTHVDSPRAKRASKLKRFSHFSRSSHVPAKQQLTIPDTPHAPGANRTTFALESLSESQWDKDSHYGRSSPFSDAASPDEVPAYIPAESKILTRNLFLLGFLLPIFWIAGIVILLKSDTPPELESGRTPAGIAWQLSAQRAAERRWAIRCLIALIVEAFLITVIAVTAKWAFKIPM